MEVLHSLMLAGNLVRIQRVVQALHGNHIKVRWFMSLRLDKPFPANEYPFLTSAPIYFVYYVGQSIRLL